MKRYFLAIVTIAVLLTPTGTVNATDEDQLKATHTVFLEGAKTGNLDLLAALIHPQALGFMRESQSVVQLKPTYGALELLPPLLADLSRFMLTPYEKVYRVIGDTGIVCSITRATPVANDPKTKKKGSERFNRATYFYTKVEGGWKLLSWHTSEVPLRK